MMHPAVHVSARVCRWDGGLGAVYAVTREELHTPPEVGTPHGSRFIQTDNNNKQ